VNGFVYAVRSRIVTCHLHVDTFMSFSRNSPSLISQGDEVEECREHMTLYIAVIDGEYLGES
jgi:hypothetical protein